MSGFSVAVGQGHDWCGTNKTVPFGLPVPLIRTPSALYDTYKNEVIRKLNDTLDSKMVHLLIGQPLSLTSDNDVEHKIIMEILTAAGWKVEGVGRMIRFQLKSYQQ